RVKKMLGTGPFMFKRENKGVSVEMVRNPNYWDKGLPYLDGIIHYIISDDLAIEGALRTKRIDMLLPTIHELKGASLRKVLKDLPDLKWDEHPVTSHRWLWPQNEKAPWNDVRVRRALLLAIDKWEVIEIAQQGAGIVGGYLQPGSGWEFPVDELAKRPGYHAPTANDIAEARRLLKEANFPFEKEWPIIVRADVKYMRNAAEVLVAHLKKLGIKTKLDPEEVGTFYNRAYAGDFDLMMMGNTMEMSDPDIVIGQSYLSGLAANYGKYSNPRVDELFMKQQVTLDLGERRRLVREIEDILFRDITRVSLWWDMDQTLWWPWVRDYTVPNNRYANKEYRTVWLADRY
ncbi:MAG: ABC transporter substrate-binding protein, partial [Chloroflexota bacterium]|nr:ABC transporter substrate-binding protein [Chloroflexota bacterium]